ncbi:MAG: hypothetical protein KGL35_29745, partial [Bradyrhizobium sp.]|nr:hypothetical protein [Bradyrhizobium sp.]
CKGHWGGGDMGVCLVGAVEGVHGWTLSMTDVCGAVNPIVRELFPERADGSWFNPVFNFNDHPDTTADDVILVLEKARAHEQVA